MPEMTKPFFSVVLFTKNRSQVVGYALESVLQQSFTDFEVIVCDNDDPDTAETAAVIKKYDDARLRYYRTNGRLSMPDNWEFGLSLARGQYITSMTDRCVLKTYALETIKKAIERHGEDVYVWGYEALYDWMTVNFASPMCSQVDHEIVSSKTLFDLVLHRTFSEYCDYIPRGFNSCCPTSLLQELRDSPVGRVCPPVNPDHTMAFLTLAYRSRVVVMNEPLFLSWSPKLSNGASVVRGGQAGKRFVQDLGMTEADLTSEVPIKSLVLHNIVCNDLLRLKRILPDLLGDIKLDLFSYFVVCRLEIDFWYTRNDPLHVQNMRAWEDALAPQSPDLVERVERCIREGYPGFKKKGSVIQTMMWKSVRQLRTLGPRGAAVEKMLGQAMGVLTRRPRFANVLEALAWIEAREQQKHVSTGTHR